jgi:hypothetical protein
MLVREQRVDGSSPERVAPLRDLFGKIEEGRILGRDDGSSYRAAGI